VSLSFLSVIFNGGKNYPATAAGKDIAKIPITLSKIVKVVDQFL